jgi:hypothetical protein
VSQSPSTALDKAASSALVGIWGILLCALTEGVLSPSTLTEGVPKVPEGRLRGFWHFWHLITLTFFGTCLKRLAPIEGEA